MHDANRPSECPSTDPIVDGVSHTKMDSASASRNVREGEPAPSRGGRGYSLKLASGSSAAAALFPVLLEASVMVTATAALAIFFAVIAAALTI